MEVKQIKSKFMFGSYDQNTYVVSNKNSAVIIDAGAEVDDLVKEIGKKKVLAILITHLHFDHIFNIEKIALKYNCPIYIVKEYNDKLYDGNKNESSMIGQNLSFKIKENQISYYNEELSIGEFNIKVYHTAGHSADSVCLLIGKHLFTGDTVFKDSIGRTDFYDGDYIEMNNSLRKIEKYITNGYILKSGH